MNTFSSTLPEKEQAKLDKKLLQEIENEAPIYSMVTQCVMKSPELAKHPSAFRTYTILNSYAGKSGVAYVSNKTIQKDYPDQTDDVIWKNTKLLIELGFVFRTLDRKMKKGTKRFLVFIGNWKHYFDQCIKIGNFKMAAEVQAFFEKRDFEESLHEIQEKFTTPSPRRVGNPVATTGSKEQPFVEQKKTTKKAEKPSLKQPKKVAAASFQRQESFEKKLERNLGARAKQAIEYWHTLDEKKQRGIRSPVAYLTKAIRSGWDKENPKKEERKTLKSAVEMNREFALLLSKAIKPSGVSSHVGRDFLEIYKGSWNTVMHFSSSHALFKSQAERTLEKMGIPMPSEKKEVEGKQETPTNLFRAR